MYFNLLGWKLIGFSGGVRWWFVGDVVREYFLDYVWYGDIDRVVICNNFGINGRWFNIVWNVNNGLFFNNL